MTSDKAQKTFDVKPSEHIVEFIHSKITNKYIKKHVVAALNTTVSDDRIIEQVPQTLEESRGFTVSYMQEHTCLLGRM